MTNSLISNEREERLKRIRLRNAARRGSINRQPTALEYAEATGDVDELLSLLDSQAPSGDEHKEGNDTPESLWDAQRANDFNGESFGDG